MRSFPGLALKELEVILKDWGFPGYYAKAIFSWAYQKGKGDFSLMSDLPLALREKLKREFYIQGLKLKDKLSSLDGTEKFLFELGDNNLIEAVSIPAKARATACVSSQAGCKFACGFCASGLTGFKRDLSCGEIVEQALYLKNNSSAGKLTHIVFMGTGEPLDNYDEVMRAIRLINAKEAFGIGARRITISTCGIVPGILKLAEEGLQLELSVSLHGADDKVRGQLMPVNRKYPLKELLAACAKYIKKTNRQVTFEYTLIKGVNSDLLNAQKLGKIMLELKLGKVNLIASNVIPELGAVPPEKKDILKFKDCLAGMGVNVTLRTSRGQDIQAACGQLRAKYEEK